MDTIKSKHGGNRPGAGRKPVPSTQLKDAIAEVNIPKIVKNLEQWSKGKEVICPHCLEKTGVYVPDTIALQSALELLNRRLGKVPQSVQLDITETIQLNADQVDTILTRILSSPEALEFYRVKQLTQGEVIEGEYETDN